MRPPKVSVAMPVYNGGSHFEPALHSVLAQTYAELEIVIVNDGSTDDGETDAICRRYADAHPDKIIYIAQDNTGVGGALNAAVRAMTGEIFCWLSHDDLFEPDKIRSQVAFFQRLGRDDAILISDYRRIGPDDEVLDEIRLDHASAMASPRIPLFRMWINGCTIFLPARLLDRNGPFDPRYRHVQDYRLWLKLVADHEFFHQPEMLVRYRIHPGQDSHMPEAVVENEALWLDLIQACTPAIRAQLAGSSWRFFDDAYAHLTAPLICPRAASLVRALRDACLTAPQVSVALMAGPDLARAALAMRNLLAQSHPALELIVLACAEHARALEETAAIDSRVRFVASSCPEEGLNEALDLSHGEYVAILRDEVRCPANAIQRQMQAMQRAGALLCRTSSDGADGPRMMHRLLIAEGFALAGETFDEAWTRAERRHPVLEIGASPSVYFDPEPFRSAAAPRPSFSGGAERLFAGFDAEAGLPAGRDVNLKGIGVHNKYPLPDGDPDRLAFGTGETPWDYVATIALPEILGPSRAQIIIQAEEPCWLMLVDAQFLPSGRRESVAPCPIPAMVWLELERAAPPAYIVIQADDKPWGGTLNLLRVRLFGDVCEKRPA